MRLSARNYTTAPTPFALPDYRHKMNSDLNLSSSRFVSFSELNSKLEYMLAQSERVHDEIEHILYPLLRHIRTGRLAPRPCVYPVWRIDRWIEKSDQKSRELAANRRHCLELLATQLLLDVIWSSREIPFKASTSLDILNFANASKVGRWVRQDRDLRWTETRKYLLFHIDKTRRRISVQKPLEPLEPQFHSLIPELQFYHRQASLTRAIDVIMEADHLYLIARLKRLFEILLPLADGILVAIRRLELIDERIWLTSHLADSDTYVSELDTTVTTIAQGLEDTIAREKSAASAAHWERLHQMVGARLK